MIDKDTIVVVGVTREDEYGNLWVTPAGGGDEVKIGSKRSQLHPLFEQGKAVMLHWESYKGKPYVSDAKSVEGELPPPVEPRTLPLPVKTDSREASIEKAVAIKEIGECWRTGKLDESSALVQAYLIWIQVALHLEIGEAINETKTTSKAETAKEIPADEARQTPVERGFKDRGEFLEACFKNLGLMPTQVCEKLKVKDIKEITNYKEAWEKINKGGESGNKT